MCLILLAYKINPGYPFILAANRDEYYRRPTMGVHWWQDRPTLLAGKDLQRGGTWLGLTRQGRFAAITNVREGRPHQSSPRSRGHLPLQFLDGACDDDSFVKEMDRTRMEYNGYNLLFGNIDKISYFSNRQTGSTVLEPGLYGLSNAGLDTAWPKIVAGKAALAPLAAHPEPSAADIFSILESTATAPDHLLPDTGVGLPLERQLSAICISSTGYGTRSSCVLLIDHRNRVTFLEKERAPERSPLKEYSFQF